MMIAIYGAGCVGLVSAVCFAKRGYPVICVDEDATRISLLSQGLCTLYEEQLPELLQAQLLSGRLHFTTEIKQAAYQSTLHFITTGTPSLADHACDLSQVQAVVTDIVQHICADSVFVIKSTVPVGTGDAMQTLVNHALAHLPWHVDVVSNPEFLREGTAVHDFLHADRIILGGEHHALHPLQVLYQPWVDQGIPLLTMGRRSAELTKYAANAMLACKISLINQISRIAETTGATIDDIQHGLSLDHRIGPHGLQAGIGYGGSCFSKDLRALQHTAHTLGINTSLLSAIEEINHLQKTWAFTQLKQHFHQHLQHKTIGIWGLAFKPGTDDLRNASSLVLLDELRSAQVTLRLFDPAAMPAAQRCIGDDPCITWCHSADEVLMATLDALVIVTEWPIFKNYALIELKHALGDAPIIDGRNCFSLEAVKHAKLTYYSVGRPVVSAQTNP